VPDRAPAAAPLTRRSFLAVATAGAGAVAVAAAGWALYRSLLPSADVAARAKGYDIRLSDIPVGTQISVKHFGAPIFIRHRTGEEIAAAEAVAPSDLLNNETLDVLGRYIGPGDDKVRRATPDGKFIALIGLAGRCVPIGDGAGDYGGWYEPCRGTHFDTSGRSRRGAIEDNLRLPAFELVDAEILRLLDPRMVRHPGLDDLLYP
jgi:ubiquinol-cytochrome c reductase iron-sulfur subunit